MIPVEGNEGIGGRNNMTELNFVMQHKKKLLQVVHVFTSMKVAMALLVVLIGAAMVGTVVPIERYDVYHSLGFTILLTLICSTIFVCSIRQFSFLCREGARRHLAPWGTLMVHIAILLIMIGALYGNLAGFNAEINLPVGKTYEISNGNYAGVQQPFIIRLEQFETQHYTDGSVSDWISHISIEREGQEVLAQEVKVNQPLTFSGVSIYQSSFGVAIQTQYLDNSEQVLQEASVPEAELMRIKEQPSMIIQPVRYVGGAVPKVYYIVYKDGREYDWGAAPLGSSRGIGNDMGRVRFSEAQSFSGLLIKRDPGIPLVWSGFILLTLGFFVSLYKKNSYTFYKAKQHNTIIVLQKGEERPE
jgi:cytochrome c biogenesis protein